MCPAALFDAKGGFGARRLREAAHAAVVDILALKSDERFLIISEADPERFPIAQALHDAAVAAGAETVVVLQPRRDEAAPAHDIVLRALETEPDAVAVVTAGRLGADPARISRPLHGRYTHYLEYLVGEGRSRAFWATGVPKSAFERCLAIDHAALRRSAQELKGALTDAVELRITSASGTELVLPVRGRDAYAEDGDLRAIGSGGELPPGAVRTPVEGGANGRLVVDGSLALPGHSEVLRSPLTLDIEEGRVTRADGADAERMQAAFRSAGRLAEQAVQNGRLTRDEAEVYASNVRRIAEVGIGLNPAARLSGIPLVDMKAAGTIHLVVGAGSRETPPGAPLSVRVVLKKATLVAVHPDGSETVLVDAGSVAVAPRAMAGA